MQVLRTGVRQHTAVDRGARRFAGQVKIKTNSQKKIKFYLG